MAIRALWIARSLRSRFLIYNPKSFSFSSAAQEHLDFPSSELVNQISSILSDFRNPTPDLELHLNSFSSKISTNLVEQVLKRCKNLGHPSHRFFLWAKSIPGFRHSAASYHILVEILASSWQFAILWDFLVEIRDSRQFEISPILFWIVFRSYSKAKLPGDAIGAFNRMVHFGIRPSIHDLDQLLYVLCQSKHVKHAQQFFDEVKLGFEPTAKTYSILIKGWGDIGRSSEARKVFDEMLQRGCSVDVLAYNSFLEALCKGRNVDEASKVFQDMCSKGIQPDAFSYSVFIRAYCEDNDIHSAQAENDINYAFRVLDWMIKYNLVPDLYTYNCIIKKLCKNNKVNEAYKLLNDMVHRRVSPDIWSFNTIMNFHCEHSQVMSALGLISFMEEHNCSADVRTYNMALKLLIRVERFDLARELWDSMQDKGFHPPVSTYTVMVLGLSEKKGKLKDACTYFEMMIEEGIPPYSSTVEVLMNRLLRLQLFDYVEILADKMERSNNCLIRDFSNTLRDKVKDERSEETKRKKAGVAP